MITGDEMNCEIQAFEMGLWGDSERESDDVVRRLRCIIDAGHLGRWIMP